MVALVIKQLLILVLTKIVLWSVGYLTAVLQIVEATAAIEDKEAARVEALAKLMVEAPKIPEFIHRAAIEIGVLALKIGVTNERFKAAFQFIIGIESVGDKTSQEKREWVMSKLREAYPDLEETALRILVELGVGQMKAKGLELKDGDIN